MNPLDIIIIVILSFCLIRGFFRGLVKELSSIVGVLAGLYFAGNFQPIVSGFLVRRFEEVPYPDLLSYFILFCGVFLIVSLLGVLIRFLLKIVLLGWADRTLGGVFGAVKGVTVVCVILIGLLTFLPKNTSLIERSRLAPHVVHTANVMIHMVPEKMRDNFEKKVDSLKKNNRKNLKEKLMTWSPKDGSIHRADI